MEKLDVKSTIMVAQMDELTETERSLIELAIEGTNRSYAPYSNFHVGAAILLKNGVKFSTSFIVLGRTMRENGAFQVVQWQRICLPAQEMRCDP